MDNISNIGTPIARKLKSNISTVRKNGSQSVSRVQKKYPLPTVIGGMTGKESEAELMKGLKAIEDGKLRHADEVEAEIAREL